MTQIQLDSEEFTKLERLDEEMAGRVAVQGCLFCKGRLHRADFPRKPRGGLLADVGEEPVMRFDLCCSVEGCRRRTLPPSFRFLSRRVYIGFVFILASFASKEKGGEVSGPSGVPKRTVARWRAWWLGAFLSTEVFLWIRSRLIRVEVRDFPRSIANRLPGTGQEQVLSMLDILLPISTGSNLPRASFSGAIV